MDTVRRQNVRSLSSRPWAASLSGVISALLHVSRSAVPHPPQSGDTISFLWLNHVQNITLNSIYPRSCCPLSFVLPYAPNVACMHASTSMRGRIRGPGDVSRSPSRGLTTSQTTGTPARSSLQCTAQCHECCRRRLARARLHCTADELQCNGVHRKAGGVVVHVGRRMVN